MNIHVNCEFYTLLCTFIYKYFIQTIIRFQCTIKSLQRYSAEVRMHIKMRMLLIRYWVFGCLFANKLEVFSTVSPNKKFDQIPCRVASMKTILI